MNDADTVIYEVRGGIAIVKVNRPEIRNALSPAAANSLTAARLGRLPANIAPYVVRRIGLARSRRLGLTAKFIDAVEAGRIGLIDRVEAPENLDRAVEEELDLVMSLPVAAIASTKRLFSYVNDRQPLDCRIYTADRLADAWETAEAKDGIAAFLEKRPARWNNRCS
jgi:methylglutaconyl-CoA hydratase